MTKYNATQEWAELPGNPTIHTTPGQHEATNIAITIDGGYSHPEDAQHMTNYWADRLAKAGLPVTISGPSIRNGSQDHRSEPGSKAGAGTTHDAHLMLTDQKIPANTRDAAMRADSSSVGMEVKR